MSGIINPNQPYETYLLEWKKGFPSSGFSASSFPSVEEERRIFLTWLSGQLDAVDALMPEDGWFCRTQPARDKLYILRAALLKQVMTVNRNPFDISERDISQ
jgi:hypothetical protein